MMTLQDVIDAYPDEEFLSADGFEGCILGVDEKTMRLIYSVDACICVLMTRDGMTYEEAQEFFDYNVEGSYMGEKTPIWCHEH